MSTLEQYNVGVWASHLMLDVDFNVLDYESLKESRFPDGVTHGLVTLAVEVAIAIENKRVDLISIGTLDFYPVDACVRAAHLINEDTYKDTQDLIAQALDAGSHINVDTDTCQSKEEPRPQ